MKKLFQVEMKLIDSITVMDFTNIHQKRISWDLISPPLPIFAQDIQTFIQLAAENLIIYFLNIYLIYIFERVTKSKREREKGDHPSAGSYP